MDDKSDSLPALHRRAVRLSKAPSVTAALVVAMCSTAGIAQLIQLRRMDLERPSIVMPRTRLGRRLRRVPTALRAPVGIKHVTGKVTRFSDPVTAAESARPRRAVES